VSLVYNGMSTRWTTVAFCQGHVPANF